MHICQPEFSALSDMRAFYSKTGMLATSENADIALIRSHIAYHSGASMAEKCSIKASRGHSYRVAKHGKHDKNDSVIRITDHFNHRSGVTGWV